MSNGPSGLGRKILNKERPEFMDFEPETEPRVLG